jgi:hypothetical protein
MDPLSTLLAAVLAGAAVALQATVSEVVKDSYAALKRVLAERFSRVDLSAVERDPMAPENRRVLARQLRESGATADADLLSRAQALLEEVERSEPNLAEVIGVELERIKAGTIRIEDIVSAGAGVRVKDTIATGDFVVGKVRAGSVGRPPGKPQRR